jgi:hypothetical protein
VFTLLRLPIFFLFISLITFGHYQFLFRCVLLDSAWTRWSLETCFSEKRNTCNWIAITLLLNWTLSLLGIMYSKPHQLWRWKCPTHCHPVEIRADNGSEFINSVFKEYLLEYSMNLTYSPPDEANGKAESHVKIAKRLILQSTDNELHRKMLEFCVAGCSTCYESTNYC